ncbi:hypothetical protein VTK73DRAFT_1138 [Phialemonium thermophilum]|uniref:Uncharacterized protein n=1 Tax=Phialemonium thermophilum TaxID=223376 RepID=A0ABR3XBG6_9PEZI
MAGIFKPGYTALITGGASGIGLALAKKCRASGMKVLVADWNEESLASAPSATGSGGSLETFKIDVGKLDEWTKLKTKVDEIFGGKINLLALNAGVGRKTPWEDVSAFQYVLSTNLFGVIHGISTFLPASKAAAAEGKAAIVITGSKQGITNPPGTSPAYNASKAAVKSLAEQLAYDLRAGGPSVHLLVPGWTFTGLTKGAGGAKPAGAWWPEQVVDYLEKKMDEEKFYVICPDNDVTEETDKKRMLWSVGDIIEGRPPLSRWREDWKDKAQEWMDKQKV